MLIRELRVSGYRSLRQLRLPVTGLDVFVGPNGCGKSNLYRAMVLLSAAAQGTLARSLAEEGGMPSVLWAGPRRKGSVRMKIGVVFDDWEYDIACGLPGPTDAAFELDPLVKEERVRFLGKRRPVTMLERDNASVWLRDGDGRRTAYPQELRVTESALSQIMDPDRYPELSRLRDRLSAWRFYHQFRTDPDSPLRRPQVGVLTPVLASDGTDLAAALKTIREFGEGRDLNDALETAFPGTRLETANNAGWLEVALEMPDIQRPFEARELSDGTLRYLCLLAALLSPLPPAFLVLNEPETSIHPDLVAPLAQLIAKASERSQIWVITHSEALAMQIEMETGRPPIRLDKIDGETVMVGRRLDGSLRDEE